MMTKEYFIKDLTIPHGKRSSFINGYIIPTMSMIVLISNMFVIMIYVKQYLRSKNHIRKVSSVLYVSIATFNILSSVPVAMGYFYLFAYENVTHFMPYKFCQFWMALLQFVYFPHMSSIWYVTLLSVQRFMIIKHPFISMEKWTVKKTFVIVILIFIIPCVLQISNLFDISISPLIISTANDTNATDSVTCSIYYAEWMGSNPVLMDSFFFTMKMIVLIIIPCVLIVYCDFSLILVLQEARQFRKRSCEHRKVAEDTNECPLHGRFPANHQCNRKEVTKNRHEMFIVLVFSSVIFVVHIPYTVIVIQYIYGISNRDYEFIKSFNVGVYRTVIDLIIHFTHPLLFILSCAISKQFRSLFVKLFVCTFPLGRKRTRERTEMQEL